MLKHGRTVFEQDEQYFLEVLHSLFPVTLHDKKKSFVSQYFICSLPKLPLLGVAALSNVNRRS